MGTFCYKDHSIETTSNDKSQRLLDNDIVSNEVDMKEEKINIQTSDIDPPDIAYDFDPTTMRKCLMAGFCRNQNYKIKISNEIIRLLASYYEQMICLYITVFDTKQAIRITVNRYCDILTLKQIINDKTSIPIEQQGLQTKNLGKPLHDQVSIDAYGLQSPEDHLTLTCSYFDDQ